MWQYNKSPNPDELYHYGIIGMRWGQKKGSSSRSKSYEAKLKKKGHSQDSINTKMIRKKKVGQLTNQELRDANNRLQLESQYKDLANKQNKGKQAVRGFIKTAATITAITAASATYKKVGSAAIQKIGKLVIRSIH